MRVNPCHAPILERVRWTARRLHRAGSIACLFGFAGMLASFSGSVPALAQTAEQVRSDIQSKLGGAGGDRVDPKVLNGILLSILNTEATSVKSINSAFAASKQNLLSIPATGGKSPAERNYQNYGASIQRLNDRVFVGAATANDGTSAQSTKDWLEAMIPITTTVSQFASISTIGGFGVLGAARSSDGGTGVGFDVGVAAFAIGDDTVNPHKTTTAFYSEARRLPNLGPVAYVLSQENDIHNMQGSTVGSMDPYDIFQNLTAGNTWLASGKPGLPTIDATVALGIINNGSKYLHGIEFHSTALTGDDGKTGVGSAISMAKGHQIEWYVSGQPDSPQAGIRSDIGNVAAKTPSQLIDFTDGAGITLGSASMGAHSLQVAADPQDVNSIRIAGGHAGAPATISASGNEKAISLEVAAKGAGDIVLASSAGKPMLTVDAAAHVRVAALAAPTLSSCGTSASVSGSDQAGLVTVGTGGTTCLLAFATPYAAPPYCVSASMAASSTFSYAVSPKGLTLSGVAPGGRYTYVCMAQNRG